MPNKNLSLFERVLYEADGDPPDIAAAPDASSPPDITTTPESPPDSTDAPPDNSEAPSEDAPELGEDPFSMDDSGDSDDTNDADNGNPDNEEAPLDEKISSIMNLKLYQRFLTLLNKIDNQISMMNNNNDIINSLSKNSPDSLLQYKKLDENIRLYLSNYFSNENYSKNLLFFNKVLNLLKLLNDEFNNQIGKSIKASK